MPLYKETESNRCGRRRNVSNIGCRGRRQEKGGYNSLHIAPSLLHRDLRHCIRAVAPVQLRNWEGRVAGEAAKTGSSHRCEVAEDQTPSPTHNLAMSDGQSAYDRREDRVSANGDLEMRIHEENKTHITTPS